MARGAGRGGEAVGLPPAGDLAKAFLPGAFRAFVAGAFRVGAFLAAQEPNLSGLGGSW
jgi:hypothetical protein